MNQEQLSFLYESAEERKKAHSDVFEENRKTVQNCSYYKSEKEALEAAIKIMKERDADCQIWAKIEKDDDIYRIVNWWLVTDDVKVKMAADYIGMALMYDETRLQNIIYYKAKIDDVIAYD